MQALTLPVPGRFLITGFAIFCVAGASAVGAQHAPVGTYHSRSVTLELTSSGQARFSNAFGPLIIASYLMAADTITFSIGSDLKATMNNRE